MVQFDNCTSSAITKPHPPSWESPSSLTSLLESPVEGDVIFNGISADEELESARLKIKQLQREVSMVDVHHRPGWVGGECVGG